MGTNKPKPLKKGNIKKGKLKNLDFKSNDLKFGTLGLKAAESGVISIKQFESAKRIITRKIKKQSKIWIRVFPNLPITSNPIGVRMGKGKGPFSHWGSRVKSGTVIFEICGEDSETAYSIFKTAGSKLPVKTCQTVNPLKHNWRFV